MKSVTCILSLSLLLGGSAAKAVAQAGFEPTTCRNGFTVQQEITEGSKVAAKVYQQMPVLPDSDPVTQYVQRLGARLVTHTPHSAGLDNNWPYNFHVVASEDINAFALPGGSVFVNLGTVQAAETEAQLAGVMAHEISHVVMRHSTCNLTRQQKKGLLYGILGVGSAVLLGNSTAGSLAQAGIGGLQGLDFLHMSRDDEKQADLLGTEILYEAGYDPRGLPQFFETIRAKYGQGGAQFLSDHPNPGNRTEYVNAEIATLPQRSNNVVTTPEFKRMHADAMQKRALSAKDVQGGAWKQTGLYSAGPGGGVMRTSAGAASTADTQNQQSPTPLSRAQLALDGTMSRYQGAHFSLQYPARWSTTDDGSGGVIFAPAGGAGPSGITYGVLVTSQEVDGDISTQQGLAQATTALVERLVNENSGLAASGRANVLQVAGQNANSVELRGRSPLSTSGRQVPERDLLVTVARPDGQLNYLVFVAPEQDFATLQPTFSSILQSFRAR